MGILSFLTSHDVILVALAILIPQNILSVRSFEALPSCESTQTAYTSFGYDANDVPKHPVPASDMKMCNQVTEQVCCTPEMEVILETRSREEHDIKMNNLTKYVVKALQVQSRKFDDFFHELMEVTQTRINDVNRTMYGAMFQPLSHAFNDLFKDFEEYYTKGKIDLLDSINRFFDTVLKKMVVVYNSQFNFTDQYLTCALEHAKPLKPFGDDPEKLSMVLKKSFVGTRTLVQALRAGHKFVRKILKIDHGSVCGVGLLNMNYCQMCLGTPDLKICTGHCINSFKKCVVSHPEVNKQWNTYITSLLLLAERLEGRYNIESAIDPLDIRVSNSIMDFQERGHEISSVIFKECGTASLEKREAHDVFPDAKDPKKPPEVRVPQPGGTPLNRLMRATNKKVKLLMDYWQELPIRYCNSSQLVVSTASEEECWNGVQKTKNNANGVEETTNKPNSVVNTLIGVELINLRRMLKKVKNAYDGLGFDWLEYEDTEDNREQGSGSGSGDSDDSDSGSGSGDADVLTNNEQGSVSGSGSGSGSGDDYEDEVTSKAPGSAIDRRSLWVD